MDLGFAHLQARAQEGEGYLRNLFALLPRRVGPDAGIEKREVLYCLPGKVRSAISDPLRKLGMNDPFVWSIHKCVTEAKSRPHIPCDIVFINGVIFLARWQEWAGMPWISCILQEVHRVTEFLQPDRLTGSTFYGADCIPCQLTCKDRAEGHIMPYLVKHTPPVGYHYISTEDFTLGAGQPHMKRRDIGKVKMRRFRPVLNSSYHVNRVLRLNIYLI